MYRRMYGEPNSFYLPPGKGHTSNGKGTKEMTSKTDPKGKGTKEMTSKTDPKGKSTKEITSKIDKASDSTSKKRTYSLKPKKLCATVRDIEVWKRDLDEKRLALLEELRRALAEREENNRVKPDELEKIKVTHLIVEEFDELVEENTKEHHTDRFEITDKEDENGDPQDPQLVVRRGQEFKLSFTFQRPWTNKDDDMLLVFKIGEDPTPSKGTMVAFRLEEGNDTSYMTGRKRKWGARIAEKKGNTLIVAVYSPPNTIVGEWEYSLITSITNTTDDGEEKIDRQDLEFDTETEVIILCNAWCPDDDVYVENDMERIEYVLNSRGLVHYGSYRSIRDKPWLYGQYRGNTLRSVLQIMRKQESYKISMAFGDPKYMTRAFTRALNSCDNAGVLSGNWSGDYSGGTSPLKWKGSYNIIDQYVKSNFTPVQYGQCWVFAHLFCTFSRALGIPCRAVTNFASAHDTDGSLTIDTFLGDDDEPIKWMNGDSVWNFHVWNECWFRWPKNHDYDGWMALDATPQEESGGMYQCGPCPVKAIKNGDVEAGFDGKFIFAEVNSDRVTWRHGNPPRVISKTSSSVGKCISTKTPTGMSASNWRKSSRLDVTDHYKHPEGSAEERQLFKKALEESPYGEILIEHDKVVSVDVLEIDPAPVVGHDFKIRVKVQNLKDDDKDIRWRISVTPSDYRGEPLQRDRIAYERSWSNETLRGGESKIYEVEVTDEKYLDKCDEQLTMTVIASVHIRGCADAEVCKEDIAVTVPDLEIELSDDKVKVTETVDVTVKLCNPMKKPMTCCKLNVDGDIKVLDKEFTLEKEGYSLEIDDLGALEQRDMTFKVKPNRGPKTDPERDIEVSLESKELGDILDGCKSFEVFF